MTVTPAQLRALHAAARQRGLDHEQLRSLACVASLRELSRVAAADLLDRLNAGASDRPPARRRRPKNVFRIMTAAQRDKIALLRLRLGWPADVFQSWLSRRHFGDGRPMTRPNSARDAAQVIELLKVVIARKEAPDGPCH